MHLITVGVGLRGRLSELEPQLDYIRLAVNDATGTDFTLDECSLARPTTRRRLVGRRLQAAEDLILQMERVVASAQAAQAAAVAVNSAGVTVSSLQAALIARGVTGATALNPPVAEAVVVYRSISPGPPPARPSGGDDANNIGLIIGSAVGGVFTMALCWVGYVLFRRTYGTRLKIVDA